MPTTSEEVLMRLGFATDSFDAGVRKVKAQMGETAEHIVEHMRRPRAATLAFHHALHELTNISPLVGTALQAAFNPAVGLIAVAGFGLKFLYDGLQETRKQAKEAAKEMEDLMGIMAGPVGNSAKAKEGAIKGNEDDRRRMDKDRAEEISKAESHSEKMEQLESDIQKKRGTVYRFQSPEAETERDTLRLSAEKADLDIKSTEKSIEEAEKLKKKHQEVHDAYMAQLGDLRGSEREIFQQRSLQGGGVEAAQLRAYQQAAFEVKTFSAELVKLKDSHAKIESQLKDGLAVYEDEKHALTDLENAHKKLSDEKLKVAWEAAKDEDEVFKWAAEQKKKHHEKEVQQMEFDQRRSKLMREEKRAEIEPFLPTIQQLAKIPNWGGDTFRFNMPQGPLIPTDQAQKAGEMSRELIARESDLRATILAEGPKSSRAQEDLNRINQLKGALEKTGFLKVDHAEKMSESLQELLKLGAEKGLVVKPVMAP